jgi:hypothetical protein
MHDDLMERAKIRLKAALQQTQAQTDEAATKLGPLLRKGAAKVRQAAEAARGAIQSDIEKRP